MLAALLCALLLAATPRHSAVAHAFMVKTGYPHGRPGWIVDHVVPLARGGCDCEANLQWQTVEEAKCKDSFEQWVPPTVLIRHYGRGKMSQASGGATTPGS